MGVTLAILHVAAWGALTALVAWLATRAVAYALGVAVLWGCVLGMTAMGMR
ncbi:MAG: hypothetical protein JOZ27_09510 [Caulobacteraceae bacterium]|nr:hypothetical protein [Caulobacteraceae bacterium]